MSPRRSLTMSKRYTVRSAPSQNACASDTPRPLRVTFAVPASGNVGREGLEVGVHETCEAGPVPFGSRLDGRNGVHWRARRFECVSWRPPARIVADQNGDTLDAHGGRDT